MSFSAIRNKNELNAADDKELSNAADDSISEISFSPQAEYLSVASWDNKVRIYELTQAGQIEGRAMYSHTQPVLSTHWSLDGSKVASGGCDNTVKVLDVATGQDVQVGAHDSAVSGVRWVPVGQNGSNGVMIASASWDKTVRYWDLRQNQPIATVKLPERAYKMDSARQLLVVGGAERNITIFDLSNPGTIFRNTQTTLKYDPRALGCMPGGDGFAVGTVEARVAIQYVDEAKQKSDGFSFRCHRKNLTSPRTETQLFPLNAISFHPRMANTLATAGGDNTYQFWDVASRFRLKFSNDVGGIISSGTFNRNGTIYAYAISYDWSKGHQFSNPNNPVKLKFHHTVDEEVTPKPR